MPIRYSLQPNKTKGAQPGEYRAVVKPVDTLFLEDLVKQMHQRHRNISPITSKMVLETFFEEITESLTAGNHVCTPVFNIRIGVKGSFTDADDQFYPNRHEVTFNCSTNKALKKKAAHQRAYKIEPNEHMPFINSVTDLKYANKDHKTTPGSILEIKGRFLGVDPEQSDEMIALQSRTQVYVMERVFTRTEHHLLLSIPEDIPEDTYELFIKTRVKNASELRHATYRYKLEVVPVEHFM